MQMGMTMQMTQRMSYEQRMELRQTLEQKLTQELRQELRLAIKQLLAMLQKLEICLKLGMELTLTDDEMRTLMDSVSQIRVSDWLLISHRIGRMRNVNVLATLFKTVGRWDERFSDLVTVGQLLQQEQRFEYERSQDQGHVLAFRMLLRDPRWFGGNGGRHAYDLWSLLNAVPQLGSTKAGSNRSPPLRWVLAGGWAVELLTGVHLRQHHDIDTLVLSRKPLRLDTDVVIPTNYFDVLSCTGAFIAKHCMMTVDWTYKQDTRTVHVLKPEFLFASKFLRSPRPQDWNDVKLLVRRFCKTWDLQLIQQLCKRQACDFTRPAELMQILASRDSSAILDALSVFHQEFAYSNAS